MQDFALSYIQNLTQLTFVNAICLDAREIAMFLTNREGIALAERYNSGRAQNGFLI